MKKFKIYLLVATELVFLVSLFLAITCEQKTIPIILAVATFIATPFLAISISKSIETNRSKLYVAYFVLAVGLIILATSAYQSIANDHTEILLMVSGALLLLTGVGQVIQLTKQK